jgi:hypothetical protein
MLTFWIFFFMVNHAARKGMHGGDPNTQRSPSVYITFWLFVR